MGSQNSLDGWKNNSIVSPRNEHRLICVMQDETVFTSETLEPQNVRDVCLASVTHVTTLHFSVSLD